jgi:hypothetical protein
LALAATGLGPSLDVKQARETERATALQSMETPMSQVGIPQTDSIEEMARFWDTHDLTDFQDELEEIAEPVFERNNRVVLTIHLQPQEAEAVKRIAQSKGVKQATLVRQWVLEKIHQN